MLTGFDPQGTTCYPPNTSRSDSRADSGEVLSWMSYSLKQKKGEKKKDLRTRVCTRILHKVDYSWSPPLYMVGHEVLQWVILEYKTWCVCMCVNVLYVLKDLFSTWPLPHSTQHQPEWSIICRINQIIYQDHYISGSTRVIHYMQFNKPSVPNTHCLFSPPLTLLSGLNSPYPRVQAFFNKVTSNPGPKLKTNIDLGDRQAQRQSIETHRNVGLAETCSPVGRPEGLK